MAKNHKKIVKETKMDKIHSKRTASEDSEAKDEMLLLLRPPKYAKNEYLEQKPAKYVFRCRDGDIQIPEYGMLRSDFYHEAWIAMIIFIDK